jgi:hypothetical protein
MVNTAYTVEVEPYLSTQVDDYNNPIDAWGEPRKERVYGWAPSGSFETTGWRSTVTSDAQLLVPPAFSCGHRDRVKTPDGFVWEVKGDVERYDHGPFSTWAVGGVVNLIRFEGSK